MLLQILWEKLKYQAKLDKIKKLYFLFIYLFIYLLFTYLFIYLFFASFLSVFTNLFGRQDRTLNCVPALFWDFFKIFYDPKF